MTREPSAAGVARLVVTRELAEHVAALHGDGVTRCILVLPGDADAEFDDDALRTLLAAEQPLLFAASGIVSGANLDAALAADVRIAAVDATFAGPTRLPHRAVRLLRDVEATTQLAPGIDAKSALAVGLVSQVVTAEDLESEALRIATTIASRGPIATRLAKEAVWRGLNQEFEQALRFETDLTLLLQTTKDRAEGVRAFIEKRPPVFIGE